MIFFSMVVALYVFTCSQQLFAQEDSHPLDSLMSGKSLPEQIGDLNDYVIRIRTTDPMLAKNAAQKALRLANEYGDVQLKARSKLSLGSVYYLTAVYDSAEIYYQMSGDLFGKISDSSGMADVLIHTGAIKLSLSNYSVAKEMFESALEISEKLNDTVQMMKCLQNLGNIYYYTGNFSIARKYYQRVLQQQVIMRLPDMRMGILINIGALYEQFDEFDDALSHYTVALALADSLNNKFRKAMILMNMGNVYMQINRSNDALGVFAEAYYINETIDNKKGLAATLSQMGVVYEMEGNPQRANELYIQSLQLSEELGDRRRVAITLAYIGENLMKQGYYTNALSYFRNSLKMSSELELAAEIAEIYKWMTFIHSMNGSIDSADVYIEKYARLYHQMDYYPDEEEVNDDIPDEKLSEKSILNVDSHFIIPFISLVFITGLVAFLFLLMAFIISNRQKRKKIYPKSRTYY